MIHSLCDDVGHREFKSLDRLILFARRSSYRAQARRVYRLAASDIWLTTKRRGHADTSRAPTCFCRTSHARPLAATRDGSMVQRLAIRARACPFVFCARVVRQSRGPARHYSKTLVMEASSAVLSSCLQPCQITSHIPLSCAFPVIRRFASLVKPNDQSLASLGLVYRPAFRPDESRARISTNRVCSEVCHVEVYAGPRVECAALSLLRERRIFAMLHAEREVAGSIPGCSCCIFIGAKRKIARAYLDFFAR